MGKIDDTTFYLLEALVNIEFLIEKLKPIVGETNEIVNAEEYLKQANKFLGVEGEGYGTEV
jgi:hypothetical protein